MTRGGRTVILSSFTDIYCQPFVCNNLDEDLFENVMKGSLTSLNQIR